LWPNGRPSQLLLSTYWIILQTDRQTYPSTFGRGN